MTFTDVGRLTTTAARTTTALYEGTVRHRRRDAFAREFTPTLFLAYLDVDALPAALDGVPFWSARRIAPVHFRRRDFFDGGTRPLGDAIRDLVERRIGLRPAGQICLLAHLRTFGWLFNPMTVYYCWTADGARLDAVVLEVTNTPWGERQWYVFDASVRDTDSATKAMHVSPFLPMDVDYRVTWTPPGSELALRIAVERAHETVFEADLALRRIPLDRRQALLVLLRHPLMPLRVSLAIYREALRMFVHRVAFHRHPERPRGGNP